MTQTPDDGRSDAPKVFLSYAHDDDDHVSVVLELAHLLMGCGIAVELDAWYSDSRRDWYAWILREIPAADFVIVVASPKYHAVGDGASPGALHRGVQAEAAALRELLYRDREKWVGKVLPVVLPGRTLDELPIFTQPYTASHFTIRSITEDGIEELLRVLTGQPRHLRPARGKTPLLPQARAVVPGFTGVPTVWRVAYLLVLSMLAVAVLALPGDSAPESLAVARESEAGDGGPGGGPSFGGAAPTGQGVVEILAVGHQFTSEVDRIKVTVRNTSPESVLVEEIAVYMDSAGNGHPWSDPSGWHFTLPENMYAGEPGYNGARRTHGMIQMNGSEFRHPLVGQGYVGDRGAWKRLLTFEPQQSLGGNETVSITIDLPTTHLLQKTSSGQPAGPMTEAILAPEKAALFTRVDLATSDDRSFACHYLRRREDNPVCGSVDPIAQVTLPK